MKKCLLLLRFTSHISPSISSNSAKNKNNVPAPSSSSTSSNYRPRFRPRRLVMPVNPSDVHSSKRSNNPLYEKHKAQQRLRRNAEKRGAVTLATVPKERSVGDAFRIMLEVCEKEGFFSETKSFTPKYLQPLENLLKLSLEEIKIINDTIYMNKSENKKNNEEENDNFHDSSLYNLGLSKARDIHLTLIKSNNNNNNNNGLTLRDIDSIWCMLNNTPLDSPVHGVLALRGKAIVEHYISSLAYEAFPRLRSKHIQSLIHESCGLLSCGRVAIRLGFSDICGVNGEINMWRELNVLTERFNIARKMAAAHRQRIEKGVVQQRRWYWKAVLRSAAGRLKLFPVHQEDIIPRMEWIRDSIFAFIAFIEMAEKSGDNVKVKPLIKKLFCSQLGSFLHISQIIDNAQKKVDELIILKNSEITKSNYKIFGKIQLLINNINEELQKFRQMTEDELEVKSEKNHPLNNRADARKDQFSSSGGAHATQSLRDDIFDDYQVTRHHKMAPPLILHCIRPQNALKEAQIILRYDPNIPKELATAPIDVDQVVRRVTEVHETNPYASLQSGQQYRQVEYTICRLYAGKRCIGQGKGEFLMEAMNEAAQHTLLNYYLRKPSNNNNNNNNSNINFKNNEKEEMSNSFNDTSKGISNTIPEVRVKETLDEEILF